MADSSLAILENQKHSIREFFPGVWGGLVGDGIGLWMPGLHDLLPAWGTYQCDRELRVYHYMMHNQLWSGAHDIYSQKILSTPFEISGGRNLTFQWQDIFFEADFSEGYDFLLQKCLTDYLTLNRGFFIEKVSYGDPDTPLKDGARILGLNHLDALRIAFTGNLEYPFIYYSEETNKPHRLHRTRVIHMAHSPSPNTRMFGMGKSPLYSLLSTVNTQILLGRYHNEMLSDMPPPGFIVFANINHEDVGNAMLMFEAERQRDGQRVYRAPMQLKGKDPTQPVMVTFVSLAQVPQGYDREKYMQVDVNLTALNTQLDPQDIWPLTGQPMGTGTQSKILSSKTQVKGPGYLLTRLERMWNGVTPRPLEFKYKAQNAEQDLETAAIAEKWTAIIRDATFMAEEEKRQMAANQIPAYADVLLDQDGNLIRLPEDDPKEPGQEVVIEDAVEAGADGQPTEDVVADDTEQIEKEYSATESAFVGEVATILQDAQDGAINKASFSARMRGAINKYGKLSYLDGLNAGGVTSDEWEDADSDSFAAILADKSVFVSDAANRLYKEDGSVIGSAEYNASLWTTTLKDFYYGGVVSADKNGMYTFAGDDGKESCATCQKYKGTSHRMSWWVSHQLRPGVDTESFECKAYNCQHVLEKKQ